MSGEELRQSIAYGRTAEPPSNLPLHAAPRKRASACHRCRQQKVKCDGQNPACSNCVRAGVDCIKSSSAEAEASRDYSRQLETRIQWLEGIVQRIQPNATFDHVGNLQNNDQFVPVGALLLFPDESPNHPNHAGNRIPTTINPGTSTSLPGESPAESMSSQIGPSQPLAHDVGLLSLANSTEPKYLGPSSGVPFARLIFSSAPQSQGLSSAWQTIPNGPLRTNNNLHQGPESITYADLPKEDEMRHFATAYFELWHTLYPFLLEDTFQEVVERVIDEPPRRNPNIASDTQAHYFDKAQVFLVISLGAKALETRLSVQFSSEQYYTTAMLYIGKIQLHDSIRGVQIMLLLVLCSFSFANGLNAWFLTSTIIASCLDLGLQRQHVNAHLQNGINIGGDVDLRLHQLRSGIFWSAYSLDRTLSVILGRPLTLRDEACDIAYPGEYQDEEVAHNAVDRRWGMQSPGQEPQKKRICLSPAPSPYLPAVYSFRFDRITAEIKLMIYRVARSPTRFPWPTNLVEWQNQTHQVCKELLEEVKQKLKWRGLARSRGTLTGALPLIELKYHQCIMLLYRPSPAFPQPSSMALNACYDSAVETIRIQSESQKFATLINSWLTAHAVFVSGITLLYCLWTSPEIRGETSLKDFLQQADACTGILGVLGKNWSVAEDAQSKFQRLVELTAESWRNNQFGNVMPATRIRTQQQQQQQQQQQMLGDGVCRVDAEDRCPPMDNSSPSFWEQYNADYTQGPNMILDELGDMGAWFDLEWLGDSNYAYQADVCG